MLRHKRADTLLSDWPARSPAGRRWYCGRSEDHAGMSFRNLRKVEVMPVGDAGVADLIGARPRCSYRGPLPELVDGDPRDHFEEAA